VPECRTIAIADADRVVTEVAPVSAWAIKASLDPANLRRGLKRSERAPVPRRMPKTARAKAVKEAKPKMARAVKAVKPEEVVMEKMTKEAAKAEAVRLAPTMSVNAIVAQVGYHWGLVNSWLKEAGVVAAGSIAAKGPRKKKPGAAKKAPTLSTTARLTSATVGVQLTERNLDAFWAKCSLAEKARAFSAMFEAR
jgi:hypothetical protein